MRPLDIIVVNDCAHLRGGGDRVAIASALGLANAGHRVTFFAAVGPVDPELASHPGLKVVCLELPDILRDTNRLRAMKNGAWNSGAATSLRLVLSGHNSAETIVHVHSYTKAFSASVPCTAAELGFRTVLTLHDYFLVCPNGALFEYPAMEVCHRIPLSGDCFNCRCDARKHSHKLWRFARAWWQNRVADLPRKLSCVIAVSQTNLDTVRPLLPSTTRLELVPYPVDADAADPIPVEKNDTYLFVGRMELYKGPQLLAEAGARLNAKVVFCGEGPALEKIRAIYPAAHLAGWQDRKLLPAHFARARALVFPSLWPETFGLTAAEALARGVPVIVSRGTAASEFIKHDETGLLFNRNSADDLAKMMQRLEDPALAGKLGAEAHRRYWRDPLTLERHVTRLEAVYNSLLNRATLAA